MEFKETDIVSEKVHMNWRMMKKEYEIWYKEKDGTLHRSGLGKTYDKYEEAKEWYDWLRTGWRVQLRTAAEEEDLNKTNWSTMTWNRRKDEKFLLVEREVGPYKVLEEENGS